MFYPMNFTSETKTKQATYQRVRNHIRALIEGEFDEIAAMATIAAEIFQAFESFHWVGFYRVVRPGLLKVGPYQGGHGCLTIPFEHGVCGLCAREKTKQIVPDVSLLPYHIACSSTTRSEIVVPVLDAAGELRAVLDIDSNFPDTFDAVDQNELEAIIADLRQVYQTTIHFPTR